MKTFRFHMVPAGLMPSEQAATKPIIVDMAADNAWDAIERFKSAYPEHLSRFELKCFSEKPDFDISRYLAGGLRGAM